MNNWTETFFYYKDISFHSEFVSFVDDTNLHLVNTPCTTDKVFFIRSKKSTNTNKQETLNLKFVIEGFASYRLGGQKINLRENELLIAGKNSSVCDISNHQKEIKSISIEISQSTIDEAFDLLYKNNIIQPGDEFRQYFCSPNFLDQVVEIADLPYQDMLIQLRSAFQRSELDLSCIDHDWFVNLTKKIISREYEHFIILNKLSSSKKMTTRKEIFSRLLKGKKYMDENYLSNPGVSEVALNCNLSVFHFFRTFKTAFRFTPYHYMLQKRLQHAASLVIMQKYTSTEIAMICNFPDVFTFSKAFKRRYGFSPSRWVVNSNAA